MYLKLEMVRDRKFLQELLIVSCSISQHKRFLEELFFSHSKCKCLTFSKSRSIFSGGSYSLILMKISSAFGNIFRK